RTFISSLLSFIYFLIYYHPVERRFVKSFLVFEFQAAYLTSAFWRNFYHLIYI
ncbi:unnamed protein product, partial [Larinioides sclopetarius]